MKSLRDYLAEAEQEFGQPVTGDYFEINIREETLLETWVCDQTPDGIVLFADEVIMSLLEDYGFLVGSQDLAEGVNAKQIKRDLDTGMSHDAVIGKHANKRMTNTDEIRRVIQQHAWEKRMKRPKEQGVAEAKYQGREVPLGKPMKGDVKKSKVYVRGPKGNVVKVNFGDKTMKIKKSNPKRRKSFRARHNCKNPGPRWKARYWSCRAW